MYLYIHSNLQVSSADNLCKQFGSRSGLTKCWAWSGSKLTRHSDGIPENLSKMLILKKISRRHKSKQNYPGGKELSHIYGCLPYDWWQNNIQGRDKQARKNSLTRVLPDTLLWTLCLLRGLFSVFVVCWFFSKPTFFKKIIQEYLQSVKQFGSRSCLTFSEAWSGSKLFDSLGYNQTTLRQIVKRHPCPAKYVNPCRTTEYKWTIVLLNKWTIVLLSKWTSPAKTVKPCPAE